MPYTTSRSARRDRCRDARGVSAARGAAHAGRTRVEAGRPSLYDEVTQRILGELEAGRVPWVPLWRAAGDMPVAMPRNAVSQRPYSGINRLILWAAANAGGYPTQAWLTFRQALTLGGAVRKGERGTMIVYANRSTPEERAARDPERTDEPRAIPFLKRFIVFNVAQCAGLKLRDSEAAPRDPGAVRAVGEALIRASGIEFRVGGTKAFYAPIFDFVQVPPQSAFFAPDDYYRTALHELTHATGHGSRIGRDLSHAFGTSGYAREELVAELGAAFLCEQIGLPPSLHHADYLAAWLAVLKADNRAIFRAAAAASKAADWLLARLDTCAGDAA